MYKGVRRAFLYLGDHVEVAPLARKKPIYTKTVLVSALLQICNKPAFIKKYYSTNITIFF